MHEDNIIAGKLFTLEKDFKFDSAHLLEGHPGKCANLHGHTWSGKVICKGPANLLKEGMLVDFGDIKAVIAHLDHVNLNIELRLDRPTAEVIAAWILDKVPYAVEVHLNESPGSKVIVTHDSRSEQVPDDHGM